MKKEHPNTSTPSSNTVTTREKALNWFWDELAYTLRNNIANKYFPKIHKTLTEEEIEFCYSSEHPLEAVNTNVLNPDNMDWDLYPGNEAGAFDHLDEQLNNKFDELLDRENEAVKEESSNREEGFTWIELLEENKTLKEERQILLDALQKIICEDGEYRDADTRYSIAHKALKQVTK